MSSESLSKPSPDTLTRSSGKATNEGSLVRDPGLTQIYLDAATALDRLTESLPTDPEEVSLLTVDDLRREIEQNCALDSELRSLLSANDQRTRLHVSSHPTSPEQTISAFSARAKWLGSYVNFAERQQHYEKFTRNAHSTAIFYTKTVGGYIEAAERTSRSQKCHDEATTVKSTSNGLVAGASSGLPSPAPVGTAEGELDESKLLPPIPPVTLDPTSLEFRTTYLHYLGQPEAAYIQLEGKKATIEIASLLLNEHSVTAKLERLWQDMKSETDDLRSRMRSQLPASVASTNQLKGPTLTAMGPTIEVRQRPLPTSPVVGETLTQPSAARDFGSAQNQLSFEDIHSVDHVASALSQQPETHVKKDADDRKVWVEK
ncbi:hypothetical protein IAT40_006504 [Kwoniella sp. CBS 6097]